MRYAWVIGLLLGTVGAVRAADVPRRDLARGQRAYEKQDFAGAAEAFDKAAQGAPAADLDPAVAFLDQGNALYRAGKFAEAFDAFAHARKTTDLPLQARALYNAGNCRLAQLDLALQTGQGQFIEPYLNEAQTLFEQALLLNPQDLDTKLNCEITAMRRAALASSVLVLKRVVDQAEDYLGKYEFRPAYDLLQEAQPKLQTVLALQRPESKRFQEMLTRCGQVLGIVEQASGNAPALSPPLPPVGGPP